MKTVSMVIVVAALALGACGSDGEPPDPGVQQTTRTTSPAEATGATTTPEPASTVQTDATTIAVGDSEFGRMLFDANDQAIYIFENDRDGETVCYDDCAEAWPPVYTKDDPVAGTGVDDSLLGTIKRRDGRLQVTYADKPLYFYAHEGPGEVRCHNVNLNGGLWWVIGPDGKRLP